MATTEPVPQKDSMPIFHTSAITSEVEGRGLQDELQDLMDGQDVCGVCVVSGLRWTLRKTVGCTE